MKAASRPDSSSLDTRQAWVESALQSALSQHHNHHLDHQIQVLKASNVEQTQEPSATAVSAGHQSKSCTVYKKYEDIFFLEPFYFVTILFAKVISEDI